MKSNFILLLAASIWGFAFTAQRVSMGHMGPFAFNGVRMFLAFLSLLPVCYIANRPQNLQTPSRPLPSVRTRIWGGLLIGLALFFGASLQQVGLVDTTAGNAGFITGLYVVIVPLAGLFWNQRPEWGTWAGAFLAALGLYFLSVTEQLTMSFGDFLELAGAFFWAGHVLLAGWLSRKIPPVDLALYQSFLCALGSFAVAAAFETISWEAMQRAAIPILYGGVGSGGIAYALQMIGQRDAKTAHAAIILSMESPIAALGGWLILNESLSARSLFGCGLMLAGMLLSQLQPVLFKPKPLQPDPQSVQVS